MNIEHDQQELLMTMDRMYEFSKSDEPLEDEKITTTKYFLFNLLSYNCSVAI